MVLFIIGDIDVDETFSLVFSNLKNQEYPGEIDRIYPAEPASVAGTQKEITLPVSMPMMMAGYKETHIRKDGIELMRSQLETEMVLEMLFGRSSDFYETNYNEGLINDSFSCEYEVGNGYAHSCIYAETPNPGTLHGKILEHVKEMKQKGLDQEAFSRVKKAMWGNFVMGLDNEENFAHSFIAWDFRDCSLLDFDRVYKEIDFSCVEKRFLEHFDEANFVLSIVKGD